MTIPTVSQLVATSNRCRFVRFQSGTLWYKVVGQNFTFPVPATDTNDGEFLPEDRAIFFMRWIRKWRAELEASFAKEAPQCLPMCGGPGRRKDSPGKGHHADCPVALAGWLK